jgi:Flp pilus assembly protein TadD
MGTHGAAPAPQQGAATNTNANTSHLDALTLADRLKAEGNVSSAAAMYQQAAQANPGDARPLLGLGDCFLAMGSNAEAAQAYSGALQLQPSNLDALRGLGHARILLGQPQFAITQYQTALNIAPNDIRSLNGLGVAQDQTGDHAAAQKTYHQVLTLDPANQSAKNNLALSLALAGDDAGAIKILEDVSKSSSATAVNRQNLALLYGVNGQVAQAEQASRGDLPPGAVDRNIAALSTADAAKRQELLKQALGVELKGRQYAPAAKPVTPLNELAQTSSLDEPQQPYMSASQEGDPLPVITTGKQSNTQTQTAQSGPVVIKQNGKKDSWSDWDEELVDATDVNGTTSTPSKATADSAATAPSATAASSEPSTQQTGAPRFLSSSAVADDKAAPAPAAPAVTPAAPSQPTAATSSASPTTSQTAAVPPATAPAASETPATPASTTPSTTSANAAPATQPTAATTSTSSPAHASPAATASAPTTAPAPAASASPAATASASDTASAMTVTAKTMDSAKIYTVQIASYRSEQEASAGWQALTAEQADLLAKLPHAVAKADLGTDKGIYYRLQAGSFSDRKDAKTLCSTLKERSVDCMVVEAAPASTPAAPTSTQQSMLAPNGSFVIGAR